MARTKETESFKGDASKADLKAAKAKQKMKTADSEQ